MTPLLVVLTMLESIKLNIANCVNDLTDHVAQDQLEWTLTEAVKSTVTDAAFR